MVHFLSRRAHSNHVDYNPSGDVSKDSHKASVVGFVGQVGSNGVVKNLNFTGSQTEAAVGTYCYYWFNGAIIGRNFGTVRNISADSIKLRTEGYGYKSSLAFYTYVQDAGMGVLCGRNEGTIAFTSIKNSQLDAVGNSQITYTSWVKTYYFQLTHMEEVKTNPFFLRKKQHQIARTDQTIGFFLRG